MIDDFLTQDFLDDLRIFFRCANIFKYPYSRGYIGAFLGKGMANRALLEFSTELKQSLKKIFLNYYLSQAWSFKYDAKREGIGVHADDAKVNVNFWITDDSANMNYDNGGMIIWKKTPNIIHVCLIIFQKTPNLVLVRSFITQNSNTEEL